MNANCGSGTAALGAYLVVLYFPRVPRIAEEREHLIIQLLRPFEVNQPERAAADLRVLQEDPDENDQEAQKTYISEI
jgi:hypothetical protein